MGRTNSKARASGPARTTKVATGRFVDPMLLLRTDSLPAGDQWLYELKLDGYRALAFKLNGAVHLRSRNDNDFASGIRPSLKLSRSFRTNGDRWRDCRV